MAVTAIAFLLLYAAGVVLTFRAPAYGALTAILLYFLNPTQQWWSVYIPNIRYIFFINLALLTCFVFNYSRFRDNKFTQVPHFIWLIMMILLVLLSGQFAVDMFHHDLFVGRAIKIWIFVFVFFKVIDSQKFLDWAIGCYCAGAFYASYRAWEIGRRFGARLEVINLADGTDVNGVAVAVLISIPFLIFYVFWGQNKYLRLVSLGALAFNVNALVLFNSRGAFLGLVCSIIYMFYRLLREKQGKGIYLRIVAVVVLSVSVLLYMADDSFWERMQTIDHEQQDTEQHVSRVEFWMKSFDMLRDHPFGTGGGGYEALSSRYLPGKWLSRGSRAVHSTWFEVLVSFGFQGIFVYLLYWYFCFHELKVVRKYLLREESVNEFRFHQSIALEASLVAYMVPASFIGTFFVEYSYWVPMFIAVFYRIYYLQPLKLASSIKNGLKVG